METIERKTRTPEQVQRVIDNARDLRKTRAIMQGHVDELAELGVKVVVDDGQVKLEPK